MLYLVSVSQCHKAEVGFQILTAINMKMVVFWVVAPYSQVEVYWRFKDSYRLGHQVDRLIMEAASVSETSVNFCQTTRRYNPEYSHLQLLSCLLEVCLAPKNHGNNTGSFPQRYSRFSGA
jgi:hypothetical protein